jgi:guanylate kinase
VGKDSVVARLKQRGLSFAPTTTTRARRPGEREGIDYYFVDKPTFSSLIENDELLEHAIVYGQDKGVTRAAVRKLFDAGRDVLLRVDVQGARYIKSIIPGCTTIFITAPSEDDLRKRLRERATESPEELEVRLETAELELASAHEFDYVVINDDLDRTVAEIEEIVAAERVNGEREPISL